jgi:RNA polymerase sigma factor (sigma-70 family)
MQSSDIRPKLEEYHKDCFGWAFHCCHMNREMACEVLQASYLKMLEHQNTFKGRSGFRTWAFAIIKNTAIDVLRKQQKRSRITRNDDQLAETGYEATQEANLDNKLKRLFFNEALNQLSERQRQILQLVFYHDLSLNESAEVLNISQGAVRKHYDRAKKILAGWFQKKGIMNFEGINYGSARK